MQWKKLESIFLVLVNKSGKYEKSDLANDKIIRNNPNRERMIELKKEGRKEGNDEERKKQKKKEKIR